MIPYRYLDGDPDPERCDCGADYATREPCSCSLTEDPMISLWTRTAPPARHAVRHDRRESGWCVVDAEVLLLAVRDDERSHAHRPMPRWAGGAR